MRCNRTADTWWSWEAALYAAVRGRMGVFLWLTLRLLSPNTLWLRGVPIPAGRSARLVSNWPPTLITSCTQNGNQGYVCKNRLKTHTQYKLCFPY